MSDEPIDEWTHEVLPLLRAAHRLERKRGGPIMQEQLNVELGRPPRDAHVDRILARLSKAGYFTDEMHYPQSDGPMRFALGEKALQHVAGWPGGPTDLGAQFLSAIEARIEDPATSEEEKGRLRGLRDSATAVGQGVITTLIAAFVRTQTGL